MWLGLINIIYFIGFGEILGTIYMQKACFMAKVKYGDHKTALARKPEMPCPLQLKEPIYNKFTYVQQHSTVNLETVMIM